LVLYPWDRLPVIDHFYTNNRYGILHFVWS